jgi:hypothetical protein
MMTRLALLFFVFGVHLEAQNVPTWLAIPSGLTVEQARECLETTPPNPEESFTVSRLYHFQEQPSTDSKEKKDLIENAKIYQRQVSSINVLMANTSPDNIKYLIPFLGYYSDPGYYTVAPAHDRDLEETKIEFPVFATMINTPGTAPILATYCLDKTNPDDYRMTAYIALKFVDAQTFNNISNDFARQWDMNNPKMKRFFAIIQQPTSAFKGMIDVNQITQ